MGKKYCPAGHSSKSFENGIKWKWNFIKRDWNYHPIGNIVALKEIKDSRFDIAEFFKMLFEEDLHNFLTKTFLDLAWKQKLDILFSIAWGLRILHDENLVHFKLEDNIVDDDVMRQLKIVDENQKNTSKSQKQKLFELLSYSNKLHPQSCYIGRYIHTLHGLHDLLEEIKSGKSS
ncbi:209_t:CDS:2, partial [Diversispora eburnea]